VALIPIFQEEVEMSLINLMDMAVLVVILGMIIAQKV
jgi:hypothetical protein